MNIITKAGTINAPLVTFAAKHGMQLEVTETEDHDLLTFWEVDNDCEWMFSYMLNGSTLTWRGNVYLKNEVKEELPATIDSLKKLKEMIAFVGKNK